MKAEDLEEVLLFRLNDIIEQAEAAKKLMLSGKSFQYEVDQIRKGAEMVEYDFVEWLERK